MSRLGSDVLHLRIDCMDCKALQVSRSQLSCLWRWHRHMSCTTAECRAFGGHAKTSRVTQVPEQAKNQDVPLSAGDVEGMLKFVKPSNAMLDQAVYWMNKYQRGAFFEALHAWGVPISPGMLSGLIRGHAVRLDVAAAYTAFEKWTAQGVPMTIEVWKGLACSHVHQPNPQARL